MSHTPMDRSSEILQLLDKAELLEIENRRRNVKPACLAKEQAVSTVGDDLVGLALSGGGVRSASFNLGLLQAFYRHGLIRHVDYLSTVSGGGYIGSYLSALLASDLPAPRSGVPGVAPPGDIPIRTLERELGADTAGGQPARIKQFIRGGDYLNRPLRFVNRYLIGVILNNLAIASGFVFLCMLASWAWRWLDTSPVADWLYVVSGNWVRESTRSFLPAAVLGVSWLFVWFASYIVMAVRDRPAWVLLLLTKVLLLLTGVALLVGAAVWLATPSILFDNPIDDVYDGAPLTSYTYSIPQKILWPSLMSVIGAALLPLLKPKELLHNWLQPTKWYHRWLFLIVGSALLVGLPFLLIVVFAKHDWSGAYATRTPCLSETSLHFSRWKEFWTRVHQEHQENKASPGGFIWARVKEISDQPPSECPNLAGIAAKLIQPSWWDEHKDFEASPVPLDPESRKLKNQIIDILNYKVIGWLNAVNNPVPATWSKLTQMDKEINWPENTTAEIPRFSDFLVEKAREPNNHDWLESLIQHHQQKDRIRLLVQSALVHRLTPREMCELNRLFLEVCYPEDIWESGVIRRQDWVPLRPEDCHCTSTTFVRLVDRDQQSRTKWILGSAIFFVCCAVLVNLNHTSLHGFYRDQLREAFLTTRPEGHLTLTNLDTTDHGGPYHLLCATRNRLISLRELLFGKRVRRDAETTDGFLFSRHYCGSAGEKDSFVVGSGLKYCPTTDPLFNRFRLDDAMAISAAAFNPVRVRNPLNIFLMTILNMRLGQWLPNPQHPPVRDWPCVLSLGIDLFRRPDDSRYLFVTDGGHHDNLGLWALLERRCRVIVVSDASADPDYLFADLLRIYRRIRLESGIRVCGLNPDGSETLPLDLLRPSAGRSQKHPTPEPLGPSDPDDDSSRDEPAATGGLPLSAKHYFIARLRYPRGDGKENDEGWLVYLKPTMTGDEENDLSGHRINHQEFPHDSTADQIFEEDQFESYRQLGYHIGESLCHRLQEQFPECNEAGHLWHEDFRLQPALEKWAAQWRREQAASTLQGVDPVVSTQPALVRAAGGHQ
jgi:hypothetical protein